MSLQSLLKDRNRMQLPNTFVFMSPQPGLNRPVSSGQNAKIVNGFEWNDLSLFQRQRTVQVEVDSIVFEDGRIFGRDISNTRDKLNSWLRADEEFLTQALARESIQLQSYLQSLTAISPQSMARPSEASADVFYLDRITSLARQFSALLEMEGEARLKFVCRATKAAEKIVPPRR